MHIPNRSNNHKLISEETVEKVLAQRKIETGEAAPASNKQRMVPFRCQKILCANAKRWLKRCS